MGRWLRERLGLPEARHGFFRKPFPVHTTFFLGEIAAFAFVTLVATGVFLSLQYEPSIRTITEAGRKLPTAYASVRYIDTLPFGRVIRAAHHWSAHLMIAASFLHLLTKLLTGAYKRPRELTWIAGVLLLCLAVMSAFTGYALPFDAFAVTATRIGYGITAAIPWAGDWLAHVLFGGTFPAVHSLPRLYTVHVMLLPATIAMLVLVHVALVVRHRHLQPPSSRRVAPGKILGVPLVPGQAFMMGTLFCLYMALVLALGGVIDVHPVEAYGPPLASTPAVRPDWYLLWVYGLLEMIPSAWHGRFAGVAFGPELFGAVVPLATTVVGACLLPFVDWSSRRLAYVELPTEHPVRTSLTVALLGFFVAACVAGYHESLGLHLAALWALLLGVPTLAAALTYTLLTLTGRHPTPEPRRPRSPGHAEP